MAKEYVSQQEAMNRSFGQRPITVASGGSAVLDVRGAVGLTAWFAGTCNATPVNDELGTAIPGAQPVALTSGQRLDAAAHFYEIEPAGGSAVVHVI